MRGNSISVHSGTDGLTATGSAFFVPVADGVYQIFADGDSLGTIYGETKSDAIAKARLIWKLQGYVTALRV